MVLEASEEVRMTKKTSILSNRKRTLSRYNLYRKKGELHFCPFHNFKVFDLRKLNHIIIIYNYKVPILSCMKAEFINCATTF